jgi:glycosyltransferase involved in cell wall biosynthesis
MQVVHLTSTYPRWQGDSLPGFVHGLARGLVQQGVGVTVLAPHAPGAAEREVFDGVEVCRYRYAPTALERLAYRSGLVANLRREPWLVLLLPALVAALRRALQGVLARGGVDLVHAHWALPQGWVAARALARCAPKVPLVLSVHGSDLRLPGLARPWVHQALEAADLVLAVSPALAERATGLRGAGLGNHQPVLVQSMGVAPCFQPPELGVGRLPNRVVAVGRLVPGKGFEVLLEAIARLPRATLAIVGDGVLRGRLEARAQQPDLAGRVELLGAIGPPQVAAVLQTAAVAVVASTAIEGFGLTAIEALASATPLVITEQPALANLLEPGRHALVVPRGDAAALEFAIGRLLDDDRLRLDLAGNGRNLVGDRFSEVAVARAMVRHYETALGRPEFGVSAHEVKA